MIGNSVAWARSKLTRLWRRLQLKTKVLVGAFAISVVIITHYLFAWKIVCTNLAIYRHVKHTCHLHKEGLALGDFCHDLCSDQVQVLTCQTLHAGKEVVFSAKWKGSKVYIKSQKCDFTESEDDQVYWTDSNREKHYPSIEDFRSMLASLLSVNLNISVSGDVIATLWPEYNHNQSLLTHEAMNNVWALALSNEYTLAKVFEEHGTFPRILGTCGSLYVMEHLEPLIRKSAFKLTSFEAWTQRVQAALFIIDFLDEMNHIFPQPMHLCDMKLEHFGVGENGAIKFLDLDTVFVRPVLNRLLSDGSRCHSHRECSFFSCASKCNFVAERCDSHVSNDNLQSACHKIFLGGSEDGQGTLLRDPGLLSSDHSTSNLASILRACSFPYGEDADNQGGVPADLRKDLVEALEEMLQFRDFAQP